MNWNILIARICRMPVRKVIESINEYENEIKKLQIMWGNQLLNKVEQRVQYRNSMSQEDIMVALFSAKMLACRTIRLEPMTFSAVQELNKMNEFMIAELTDNLEMQEILNILNNFSSKLNLSIIQSLILALPKEKQINIIKRFKNNMFKGDMEDFKTFFGCLDVEVQNETLNILKNEISNLSNQNIINIIAFLHPENLQTMFDCSNDKIQNFNDDEFLNLLEELKGNALVLCLNNFKEKFTNIPIEVIIFKFGLSVDDPHIIYEILKSNVEKTNEIPDTYFHLVLSRLTEEDCIDSLTTFKDRYEKLPIKTLLDLFGDSSNELKYKLFTEYENKIAELDNDTFLKYLNNNFTKAEYRKNLMILYSDRITNYDDNNFIKFISGFHDKEFENSDDDDIYDGYGNHTGSKEQDTIDLIINLFKERIVRLEDKNIPNLFSNSNSELGIIFIDILRDRLKEHINNKCNLYELINSVWGIEDFFEQFKTEFSTLNAEDWYKIKNSIRDIEKVKEFLETCDINNLEFFDPENFDIRYLEIFEKNLKGKLQNKFNEMSRQQPEEAIKKFKMLVASLKYKPNKNILLDQSYIETLMLAKVLLKDPTITAKDEVYMTLKYLFIDGIKTQLVINDESYLENISYGLFYRFIKGSLSIVDLINITSLKELLIVNRNPIKINDDRYNQDNGSITMFNSRDIKEIIESLSEEQCSKYNIKLFKRLCETIYAKFSDEYPEKKSIQYMAFKIFMSFGFEKGSKIVQKCSTFTFLEYLVNDINILGIHLDENGEPILNEKLMNFLFGSNINDENTNINRILEKKIKGFEKIFADIYNSWYVLCQELNNDISVTRIMKYFEDNQVALNPNEYELKTILVEFGKNEQVIKKARSLYENMRKRSSSVIPKVKGNYEDYEYEMLDLDDPQGLIVGYLTHCCFLINGQSRESLFHSAESRYGRIFTVKHKGKLIAQSWVWRNGNLLCFDNVETVSNPDLSKLLHTYTEASKNLIGISEKNEDDKEKIKLVTFGASYSHIEKPEKTVSKDKIILPLNEKAKDDYSYNRIYTDASTQYILVGNEDDNKYQGKVKAEYKDERIKPVQIADTYSLSTDDKLNLRRKINSIDYSKDNAIREFMFEDYCYLSIGSDWYIGITKNGLIEIKALDFDERVKEDVTGELHHIRERVNLELLNSNEIKEQALELVEGWQK